DRVQRAERNATPDMLGPLEMAADGSSSHHVAAEPLAERAHCIVCEEIRQLLQMQCVAIMRVANRERADLLDRQQPPESFHQPLSDTPRHGRDSTQLHK